MRKLLILLTSSLFFLCYSLTTSQGTMPVGPIIPAINAPFSVNDIIAPVYTIQPKVPYLNRVEYRVFLVNYSPLFYGGLMILQDQLNKWGALGWNFTTFLTDSDQKQAVLILSRTLPPIDSGVLPVVKEKSE